MTTEELAVADDDYDEDDENPEIFVITGKTANAFAEWLADGGPIGAIADAVDDALGDGDDDDDDDPKPPKKKNDPKPKTRRRGGNDPKPDPAPGRRRGRFGSYFGD